MSFSVNSEDEDSLAAHHSHPSMNWGSSWQNDNSMIVEHVVAPPQKPAPVPLQEHINTVVIEPIKQVPMRPPQCALGCQRCAVLVLV
jgi:hypothetical protein